MNILRNREAQVRRLLYLDRRDRRVFTGRLQVELVAVFARDYSSAYKGPVTAGSGAGQTMMAGYRVAIIKQGNS